MHIDISPAWVKIQAIINGFISILPNLVLALILFTISCLIARWAKSLIVGFYRRRRRHQNLGLVVGHVAQAGIILINLMIALSIVMPSFSGRDLIQLLGISSVAIGFAFRDILQNFLAGILILLAEPFRIGEEISVEGLTGIVQEIEARATLLKTSDGFLVVIPNANIYTQKVTIYNSFDTRRTSVEFGIGFRDDLEEARRLMVEAIQGINGVLVDPKPSAICVGISPLFRNLFNIAVRKLIAAVPAHAQEDNSWLEVPPLKRRGVACHVSDLNGEEVSGAGEYISIPIAATQPGCAESKLKRNSITAGSAHIKLNRSLFLKRQKQ
jgi:small conductance mechanosensitive channel